MSEKKLFLEAFEELFQENRVQEYTFDYIDELLSKNESLLDFVQECFVHECNLDRKETLAQIIIGSAPYEPAILFLKETCSYEDDDFDGYDGYKKWIQANF